MDCVEQHGADSPRHSLEVKRKVALDHRLTSVIVNNFHVVGVTVTPHKAHTPLIVHPNTMLSLVALS
jgi:hypothetical protein